MTSLSISPEKISVGSVEEVSVDLVNSGATPALHVQVRLRFPSGLSHLRGDKTISTDHLGPGQKQSVTMTLRARRPGIHKIELRHSYYQDVHGRTHPLDNFPLSVEAVSATEEQQQPLRPDNAHLNGHRPKQFAVFISYAQKGSPGIAGRLYDRLLNVFGRSRVFFDQNTAANPPGAQFPTSIKRGIFESRVVLFLIDELWKSKVYVNEKSKHAEPKGKVWLRLEAEHAWHLGCVCIPILVGKTPDLEESKLPRNLKPLANVHYLRLRFDRDFERDVEDIIEAVRNRKRSDERD